jgi:intracellular sulfur oxidation DsrE/DsrF family protein
MRRQFLTTAAAAVFLLATTILPASAAEPIKVVYHLADGIDQASRALANIRNQLRAEPDTKIVVVGLADGVKFMLRDAVDHNGKPFEPALVELAAQGVEFRICMNTLTAHNIPVSRVIAIARQVPAGVVEIARLQAREGYVYFRP